MLFQEAFILDRGVELIADDDALGLDAVWAAVALDNETLVVPHTQGTRTNAFDGLRVPTGFGLAGKSFETGRPMTANDYFADARITHHFDRQVRAEGLCRLMAVPIVDEDRVISVILGGSRTPGSFGDVAVARFVAEAERVGVAVRTARRARDITAAAVFEDRERRAAALLTRQRCRDPFFDSDTPWRPEASSGA